MILDRLSEALSGRADLRLAILYGSAAKGALRADSDIDLTVALEKPMTPADLMAIMETVTAACGRPADVADLRTAGGLFLHQILSKGTLFVNRDPALYHDLAARSLEFIEDIQPIVQAERLKRIRSFANGR